MDNSKNFKLKKFEKFAIWQIQKNSISKFPKICNFEKKKSILKFLKICTFENKKKSIFKIPKICNVENSKNLQFSKILKISQIIQLQKKSNF